MKNKYTFLRHAETEKMPNVPVVEWPLTQDALSKIDEYIIDGEFENITQVVSSTEYKSISTAKPVLKYLNKTSPEIKIETYEEFIEVKREKKFLTDEEFLNQKTRELTNLDSVENGAESARDALKRFISGMEKLEVKHNNENILIVSHGTILALYFSYLQNDLENVFSKWQQIKFCSIGKVENNKILKDLI